MDDVRRRHGRTDPEHGLRGVDGPPFSAGGGIEQLSVPVSATTAAAAATAAAVEKCEVGDADADAEPGQKRELHDRRVRGLEARARGERRAQFVVLELELRARARHGLELNVDRVVLGRAPRVHARGGEGPEVRHAAPVRERDDARVGDAARVWDERVHLRVERVDHGPSLDRHRRVAFERRGDIFEELPPLVRGAHSAHAVAPVRRVVRHPGPELVPVRPAREVDVVLCGVLAVDGGGEDGGPEHVLVRAVLERDAVVGEGEEVVPHEREARRGRLVRRGVEVGEERHAELGGAAPEHRPAFEAVDAPFVLRAAEDVDVRPAELLAHDARERPELRPARPQLLGRSVRVRETANVGAGEGDAREANREARGDLRREPGALAKVAERVARPLRPQRLAAPRVTRPRIKDVIRGVPRSQALGLLLRQKVERRLLIVHGVLIVREPARDVVVVHDVLVEILPVVVHPPRVPVVEHLLHLAPEQLRGAGVGKVEERRHERVAPRPFVEKAIGAAVEKFVKEPLGIRLVVQRRVLRVHHRVDVRERLDAECVKLGVERRKAVAAEPALRQALRPERHEVRGVNLHRERDVELHEALGGVVPPRVAILHKPTRVALLELPLELVPRPKLPRGRDERAPDHARKGGEGARRVALHDAEEVERRAVALDPPLVGAVLAKVERRKDRLVEPHAVPRRRDVKRHGKVRRQRLWQPQVRVEPESPPAILRPVVQHRLVLVRAQEALPHPVRAAAPRVERHAEPHKTPLLLVPTLPLSHPQRSPDAHVLRVLHAQLEADGARPELRLRVDVDEQLQVLAAVPARADAARLELEHSGCRRAALVPTRHGPRRHVLRVEPPTRIVSDDDPIPFVDWQIGLFEDAVAEAAAGGGGDARGGSRGRVRLAHEHPRR
mmetsp:Transcript_6471/g.21632  ORF Transcript_6471/g.21632 Transcript_6471/m.21632 type:complete len:900 (-) Transcript_6471:156-2855(-)